MTSEDPSQRDHVAAIHKALDVLECLATAPMTASEISKHIGMVKPTVYRIVRTLQSRGYVAKELDGSRYLLGTAIYGLGPMRRSSDLLSLARPSMVRLAAAFGETVNLAIHVHKEVVYIDVLESAHQLRTQIPAGTRDHLHSTALGKAILAMLPTDEVRVLLASTDRLSKTPNTVVAIPALLRQLSTVREQGFAVDDEENELGSVCVAAAFLDHSLRPLGAISVSGPRWRIADEMVSIIGAELVSVCASLSDALGSSAASASDTLLDASRALGAP